MIVYVNKETLMVQEFPVPSDVENWYTVETEEYAGKQFIPEKGTFEATEEVLAAEVRVKRDKLMSEADILVNKALDLQDKEAENAARSYRQALRDIPEQEGFPLNIEWPVPPA